jgi:hypothetical protein
MLLSDGVMSGFSGFIRRRGSLFFAAIVAGISGRLGGFSRAEVFCRGKVPGFALMAEVGAEV